MKKINFKNIFEKFKITNKKVFYKDLLRMLSIILLLFIFINIVIYLIIIIKIKNSF